MNYYSQDPRISQEDKNRIIQNYLTIKEETEEEQLDEIVSDIFRMDPKKNQANPGKATPIRKLDKFTQRKSALNEEQPPSNVYSSYRFSQDKAQAHIKKFQKAQAWCPYVFGIFVIAIAIFIHWFAINSAKKNRPVNPFYS